MTGTSTSATAGAATSAQPSTGGQIQADSATNALIITAPEPQYRQLREVIDKLDQRRAQVYVESLIAEVSADKAAEFGVQWMSGTGTGSNTVGLLGTNFSVGGTNLLTLGAAAAAGNYTASTGLNLAVGQQRNGALALGALARFLQSSGNGNVLSTPNLLTLDNEEAKIVIGQNVPFVTGSYAAAAAGTTNPFTTVERKDVGLTLKVKPQISDNGTVKMQIFQEVSSVVTATIDSKMARPPTSDPSSRVCWSMMAPSWCWVACCRMTPASARKSARSPTAHREAETAKAHRG